MAFARGVSQKYAHAHNVGGRGPVHVRFDRTHTTMTGAVLAYLPTNLLAMNIDFA